MQDTPFFLDLPIVAAAMILIESMIMRRNYRLASPFTLLIGAFVFLYLFPYIGHFYVSPQFMLARLSEKDFEVAFRVLRQFFYTWCVLSIPLMFFLSRIRSKPFVPVDTQVKARFIWILAFFLVVLCIYLGVGVGFNPVTMLTRAVRPREFLHIKTGLGPLTHSYNGIRLLLITITAVLCIRSKITAKSVILGLLVFILAVLGGTKQHFIQPVIAFIMIWQMMKIVQSSQVKKLWQLTLVSGAVLTFLLVSFVAFASDISARWNPIQAVFQYQREAYYLPLVVDRWDWSADRVTSDLTVSFVAFVPRAIWPNKPYGGLWARRFKEAFSPGSVTYHTTTMGCLTEAHMFLGQAGPFVYGVLWALLCFLVYRFMLRPSSWLRVFVVSVFGCWSYLMFRTGFTGTNLVVMVLYFVFGLIFLFNLRTLKTPPAVQRFFRSLYPRPQSPSKLRST